MDFPNMESLISMTMQQNVYQNPSFSGGTLTSSAMPAGPTHYQNNENFSPPVSTAMYGTTTTSSWAHTVPAFMPWVPEGNTASQVDPIVRFTAPFPPDPCTSQTATSWELLNNLGASKTNANLHLKRRCDLEEPEILPHKQYISEEKMAARMQQLHISNNYTIPQQSSPFGPYSGNATESPKPIKTIQELENMINPVGPSKTDKPMKRSIVLAPEIKSLVEPEKLFAKTLVHEIERPTMAVVLWKPPHGSIKDIRPPTKNPKSDKDALNNVLSPSFMLESNNNPSTSFSSHVNSSLDSLPSAFSSQTQNADEDFEMEA